MKRTIVALALALAVLPALAAAGPLPLIPQPVQLEQRDGAFLAASARILLAPDAGEQEKTTARIFAEKARARNGLILVIGTAAAGDDCKGNILVGGAVEVCGRSGELLAGDVPAEEGYKLAVKPDGVLLVGSPHGLHNGLATLLQLIAAGKDQSIPAVAILDYPRFPWRGMLLDPARSFLPPDIIKKYIDIFADLKINRLHWHLVDDQGWRIESKVYPKLHEVGGILSNQNEKKNRALDRHGWGANGRGYYTQDELKEIVAYAAERHVMIVPEIDVPGHTSAMIAAYPELQCSGEQIQVPGVGAGIAKALCPGKEEVYVFLDNLFGEIASIFPAPYVHIGGDEVWVTNWMSAPQNQELIKKYGYTNNDGLQSYFTERVNQILKKHGKTMIGWDEITEYLPEGSIVQAWRKHEFATQAAEKGHSSIVSPTSHCYIDYPQLQFTVKKLYGFEPLPAGLKPGQEKFVLGAEVNLWGERVTLDNVDQKAFPRLIALAEITWSPREARDWNGFVARLAPVKKDMKKRGVKFGATWRDIFLLP